MKWINAADGPVTNWVHVMVDGVPYCVSKKDDEIHYEGKEPADLDLLLNSDKHRRNLAERASLAHRENGDWSSMRSEKWSVHYGNKNLSVMWDGSLAAAKKKASAVAADNITIELGDVEMEEGAKMSIKPREPGERHDKEKDMEDGKDAAAAKTSPEAQKWISRKIKKLVDEGKTKDEAAGQAYNMAREKGFDVSEKKADNIAIAEDIDQMSLEMFNKPYEQMSDEEVRQLLERLKGQLPSGQMAPSNPAPSAPVAPPAPGQASASVRWMRSAADDNKPDDESGEVPGEVKEEKDKGEAKDEKKDDKEDEKKAPAKDDKKGPEKPKAEPPAGDVEKAVKALEKALKKEESENEPHAAELAKALDILKNFLKSEEAEPANGIPTKVDLEIVKDGPGAPGKPPMLPPMQPMPAGPKEMPGFSWLETNDTGFRNGDRVWRKDMVGSLENIGDEAGRVMAVGGGKVIVDWGDTDGIPAEEDPAGLVMAADASGEAVLFSNPSSTNTVIDEASQASDEPVDEKAEIEKIMSGMSVRDILNKKSSPEAAANGIVHIATGRIGEFMATAADGRCLVNVGGEEMFVWPYEIEFQKITGGFTNG